MDAMSPPLSLYSAPPPHRPDPTAKNDKILEAGGVEVETVVLPDGEEFKSLEVLTKILDKALAARLDRKTTFVALGGGVIGDMVGFAAAIYQRGVKFVQVWRCFPFPAVGSLQRGSLP